MPKPVCTKCNSIESLLWRPTDNGQICNDCFINETAPQAAAMNSVNTEINGANLLQKHPEVKPPPTPMRATRRSTRSTRFKSKAVASKPPIPKGRGRRSMFKKTPVKAPSRTATIVTSDSVYFKSSYMQIGDIVSMLNLDGGTYYAQIRKFVTDQYCEKSAVVTWLLPTKSSPPPELCFDPATYIIGPEENLPRKLDYMEFIMHAPSDYYKSSTTPYPPVYPEVGTACRGFIWSSMDPIVRK